ncbi:hypothetical protein Aau02nite_76880 [Amorphoplanes auranticolor]|uniref:Uncharacterized protein n=1 Tax=Actinoplanes auranticolor TaxID=47988 RepID=A0A919STG1_9ACTN|nr:hypothetical protein Aau02nite_76880 [Actinoplanes auranticolor]
MDATTVTGLLPASVGTPATATAVGRMALTCRRRLRAGGHIGLIGGAQQTRVARMTRSQILPKQALWLTPGPGLAATKGPRVETRGVTGVGHHGYRRAANTAPSRSDAP